MSTTTQVPLRGYYDPVNLTLSVLHDNSTMEYGITCPRAYEFYAHRRRESARTRSSLIFGQALHEGLATRYQRYGTSLVDTLDDIHAAALRVFTGVVLDEEEYRTPGYCTALLTEYNTTYPFEDFTLLSDSAGLFVERPFAIPLGDVEINADVLIHDLTPNVANPVSVHRVMRIILIWTGRIDLAYVNDGRNYLMDHKSTSMMGPSFFKEFELSSQFCGYLYAASAITGQEFHGLTVNALGARKPTRTGKGIEFARQTITYSKEQLLEWRRDTLTNFATLTHYFLSGYFPKGTKWCVGKYGACQYLDVCIVEPSMRDTMLSTNLYRDVTWSPLT